MGSFKGCTFKERGQDGTTFPIWPAQSITSEKDRPGGRLAIVQEIGADIERFGLVARVSKAELLALYDQVLQEGELVFGYETCTALLCGVPEAAEQGAGKDKYFATLDVIRLDDVGPGAYDTLTDADDSFITDADGAYVTNT